MLKNKTTRIMTRSELTTMCRHQRYVLKELEERVAALEPKPHVPDPNQIPLPLKNLCNCIEPQRGLGTRHCLRCHEVLPERAKQ